MKRILFLILGTLWVSAAFGSRVSETDADGHRLTALWQAYAQAEAADKPQDQLDILERIEREADRKRYLPDYYDALSKRVAVRTAVNWKDRKSARQEMRQKIEAFGEPLLVFFIRKGTVESEALRAYVRAQRTRLQAAHHPEFYVRDGSLKGKVFYPALLPLLDNDYAYVLWSMGNKQDLLDYYGERYPFRPFVEYQQLTCDKTAFAKRYAGKAVSMLARQDLLQRKLYDAEDYKALRAEAVALARERDAFTGTEAAIARCCRYPEELIRKLDASSLSLYSSSDTLWMVLRNLPSVQLSFLQREKLLASHTLPNPARSYYAPDTLAFPVPVSLPDGEYNVVCRGGGLEETCRWEKYGLSIAARRDADGTAVFVADACTGRPLDACTLAALDDDGTVLATCAALPLNGFTRLPDSLTAPLATRWRMSLRAEDVQGRRSQAVMLYANSGFYTPSPARHAVMLTDRAAFHPEETVQVKAILYEEYRGVRTPCAGTDCALSLLGPSGEVLETKSVCTGPLGSVADRFYLPRTDRGGTYTLVLRCGEKDVASAAVTVDDFVLPGFVVDWEKESLCAVAGDTLRIRGQIKSFSGHSLAEARAWCAVTRLEQELALSADGRFEVGVPTAAVTYSRSVPVEVRVADGSGETRSFRTYAHIIRDLSLSVSVENEAEGRLWQQGAGASPVLLDGETARLRFHAPLGKIAYRLYAGTQLLEEGQVPPDGYCVLDLSGRPDGCYTLEATARLRNGAGKEWKREERVSLLKMAPDAQVLPVPVTGLFRRLDTEDGVAIQLGAAGSLWVSVEVFGEGNRLLDSRVIHTDGGWGHPGSLQLYRYARKPGDPGHLSVKLLYFHDWDCICWAADYVPPRPSCLLPLQWTCFKDRTMPGQTCEFSFRTQPGAECAVAVYDRSTEEIHANGWRALAPSYSWEPQISYQSVCGTNRGNRFGGLYASHGADRTVLASAVQQEMAEGEPAVKRDNGGDASVPVREDFAATLAWEPLLAADADGCVRFRFRNADKLATFRVQAFVHDATMRTAAGHRDMLVTLPARVDIVPPQQLYTGDHYVARVSVTSLVPREVPAEVTVQFMHGGNRQQAALLRSVRVPVQVPAAGGTVCRAEIDVPAGVDTLGILAVCKGDDPEFGADAMWVRVPVFPPVQTLTEAHSALLSAAASRDSLLAGLAARFVNVDAKTASSREVSIREMVLDALPEKIVPRSDDALSLADALYAAHLLWECGETEPDCDTEALYDKLYACHRPDGGFGWFKGLSSSPMVTALVLRRLHAIGDESREMLAAVSYLDSCQFLLPARPAWCGGLSLSQYLDVRALFPQVPFPRARMDQKAWRTFRKEVKSCLLPSGRRGLNGQLLAKARRIRILSSLTGSGQGKALARTWKLNPARLAASRTADLASLAQYAVAHPSGGRYFPNAVMPWRGLLETELCAHSMLCTLFAEAGNGALADDLRLWMMVQKETQQWDSDPGYLEALAAVLEAPESLLETRVLILQASAPLPFASVSEAGNGFRLSCRYFRDGQELQPGDSLSVGDRIRLECRIWNEENRSFVRVALPRPALLRPEDQLSRPYGWRLSPLSLPGGYRCVPQGYRSVFPSCIEYRFDSYPEGETSLSETYFVTQEGRFQSAVPEVESLYAPHYRANAAAPALFRCP
ncbi:MAG: hypothetical protein J5871_06475 [Bacteroidales bacterium]|nr:hypothetical protein [Bacteroidales bacterium]